MASVYGRVTKLTNVVGRADYITDVNRQEEIVLHNVNMKYSWKQHSEFEKLNQKSCVANNEALEVHIALPNILSKNIKKLEQVCNDLVFNIVGAGHDYEYAVHWNHNRTNLHLHLIFSERENQEQMVPKIYKRDIYYNFENKKLSKKSDPQAKIIHHQGEIQKDNNGDIKYQTDILKTKDKKFVQKSWVHEKNRIIEKVMKSYGYDLLYQDKDSPYLAQKKLYKGARVDYLKKAQQWNTEVKRYNNLVKQHIELEPNQLENYMIIKKEILENVKESNAIEKKITPKAIEIIHEMSNWIQQTLRDVKVFINTAVRNINTMDKWQEVKEQFYSMFNKNQQLDSEIKGLYQELDNYNNADLEYTQVINSKKDLIEDIEDYQENQKQLLFELKELEYVAYQDLSLDEYTSVVKGLSFKERKEKAEDIINDNERNISERSSGYDIEL